MHILPYCMEHKIIALQKYIVVYAIISANCLEAYQLINWDEYYWWGFMVVGKSKYSSRTKTKTNNGKFNCTHDLEKVLNIVYYDHKKCCVF